jgi:hypothetical protein
MKVSGLQQVVNECVCQGITRQLRPLPTKNKKKTKKKTTTITSVGPGIRSRGPRDQGLECVGYNTAMQDTCEPGSKRAKQIAIQDGRNSGGRNAGCLIIGRAEDVVHRHEELRTGEKGRCYRW